MSDSQHVFVATDDNFDKDIKQFKGVVVLDFWAEWCTPCKAISPFVEELAEENVGNANVRIAKMNTDENTKTAMENRIMSIPNVKFLVNKTGKPEDFHEVRVLNGFVGPATGDILKGHLKAALEEFGV